MEPDSVLREVRAARDAFARSHGNDERAMVEDLRNEDDRGDRPVVRLAPRRPAAADVSPSEASPKPSRTPSVASHPSRS
jgi:hypothetical protein